jgi:hypothetical protein
VPDDYEAQLEKLDNEFFTSLYTKLEYAINLNPRFKGLRMSEIQALRKEFYDKKAVDKYSKLLVRLLGGILRKFGFEHTRDKAANYWRAPLKLVS